MGGLGVGKGVGEGATCGGGDVKAEHGGKQRDIQFVA